MLITDFSQYKVVEGEHFLMIVGADIGVNDPKSVDLIISNMTTCAEYIARYGYERSQGLGIRAAHKEALKGARIIAAKPLNIPPGVEVQ